MARERGKQGSFPDKWNTLTPQAHLNRNPTIGAQLLADQLTGKFGGQERDAEDGISQVIVVRRHSKVRQEVVRVGLRQISTVKVKLFATSTKMRDESSGGDVQLRN